jgi:hypothetical protein
MKHISQIVQGSTDGLGLCEREGGECVENIDAQTFSPMWEGRRNLLTDCYLDGVVQLVRFVNLKVDQHDQNKDNPNEILYREKRWKIVNKTNDLK